MITAQACGNCRAFGPNSENPAEGVCRRHPPAVNPASPGWGLWPAVTAREFCCEWLPHPVTQTPLTETTS